MGYHKGPSGRQGAALTAAAGAVRREAAVRAAGVFRGQDEWGCSGPGRVRVFRQQGVGVYQRQGGGELVRRPGRLGSGRGQAVGPGRQQASSGTVRRAAAGGKPAEERNGLVGRPGGPFCRRRSPGERGRDSRG
ncbi:MAG: hypothetical protein WBK48_00480 [Dethiobacteria bacterium]|nr:hypothetical protein [Bacillota bacterium]HQD06740.1 hypothetical protein [Bacillota bacterium]